MYRWGICLTVIMLLATGCVRVEYLDYQGKQAWPTGSAFVSTVDNIKVYEGLPQVPYEVIGLIDVYDESPFDEVSARSQIVRHVRAQDGDALIWLSDRLVASGSVLMGELDRSPVTVDAGRSSDSISTLLLIRWKSE